MNVFEDEPFERLISFLIMQIPMKGVAGHQSKSLRNVSRVKKMKIQNCWTSSKFRQSILLSWNGLKANWFRCSGKFITWNVKILASVHQSQNLWSANKRFEYPLPPKRPKPWVFWKQLAPRIDSDFFSTENEIKTSGALSQGRWGCRKELKLRKVLELFKRTWRISILTRNEAGNRRKTFWNVESFINWNALNSS